MTSNIHWKELAKGICRWQIISFLALYDMQHLFLTVGVKMLLYAYYPGKKSSECTINACQGNGETKPMRNVFSTVGLCNVL